MLMAGPQSRYTGYTAAPFIANRMRKNGVKVYSIGISPAIIQRDVLNVGGKSDYVTYSAQYQGIMPSAAPLALAVQQRKCYDLVISIYKISTI
jgi:hypothetical protein